MQVVRSKPHLTAVPIMLLVPENQMPDLLLSSEKGYDDLIQKLTRRGLVWDTRLWYCHWLHICIKGGVGVLQGRNQEGLGLFGNRYWDNLYN